MMFKDYYTVKMTEKYYGSYNFNQPPDFKIRFLMMDDKSSDSYFQDQLRKFIRSSSENAIMFMSKLLSREYNKLL